MFGNIRERINIYEPYANVVEAVLTQQGNEVTVQISSRTLDLFVESITVQAIDDTGKILDENNSNAFNLLSINISDAQGTTWSEKPMSILEWKNHFKNIANSGVPFLLQKLMTYNVIFIANSFPSSPIADQFPIRVKLSFMGRKLLPAKEQINTQVI